MNSSAEGFPNTKTPSLYSATSPVTPSPTHKYPSFMNPAQYWMLVSPITSVTSISTNTKTNFPTHNLVRVRCVDHLRFPMQPTITKHLIALDTFDRQPVLSVGTVQYSPIERTSTWELQKRGRNKHRLPVYTHSLPRSRTYHTHASSSTTPENVLHTYQVSNYVP